MGLYVKPLYVLRMHTFVHKLEKGMMCMQSELGNMPRERVSITLPEECVEWIDEKVRSRTYANRSHAIEVIVLEAMKRG